MYIIFSVVYFRNSPCSKIHLVRKMQLEIREYINRKRYLIKCALKKIFCRSFSAILKSDNFILFILDIAEKRKSNKVSDLELKEIYILDLGKKFVHPCLLQPRYTYPQEVSRIQIGVPQKWNIFQKFNN